MTSLAVIGGVASAASGIAGAVKGSKDAKSARSARDTAMQNATNAAQQNVDMWQKEYNNWNTAFGDTQQAVSNYYNSLSASKYEAKMVQNLQQSYNQASTQLNQNLAQRGITLSGAAAAAQTQLAQSLATQKAEANYNADKEVASEKLGYLQTGLQQKSQITSGLSQAQSNLANAYNNQANVAQSDLNTANNLTSNSLQAIGSAFGSTASILGKSSALSDNSSSAVSSALGTQTSGSLPSYMQAGTPSMQAVAANAIKTTTGSGISSNLVDTNKYFNKDTYNA